MNKILGYFFIILFTFLSVAFALSNEERFDNPAQSARAHNLFKQIRCVVCSGESINDSNADLAKSMRALVRDKIKNDHTDSQIFEYFTARYGDEVLMSTALKQETLLLWLAPLLLVFIGVVTIFVSFRKKQS